MKTNLMAFFSLVGISLVAGGCGAETEVQAAAAALETAVPAAGAPMANLVSITAEDFYFKAPSSVPAGLTTIRLDNQGAEFHHVQLVKIDEGHTMKEFLDRVAAGELVPEWIEYVGGPNTPVPGGASEATLNLEPGDYAMICVIPSKDGVPHLMKGMVVPLTVTGEAKAGEPAADLQMTLRDYAYDLSGEITAGKHTVRVSNAAEQPHEVLIVRLAPGATAEEMLQWMDSQQGPPLGMPVAGTTMLTQGEANFLTVDFEPGEYAFYCFIPDAADGKPHFAHGMIEQITVK